MGLDTHSLRNSPLGCFSSVSHSLVIIAWLSSGYTHQVCVLKVRSEGRRALDRNSAQITRAARSAACPGEGSFIPRKGHFYTYSEVPRACQALHQWVVFPPRGRFFLIHIEALYRLARALEMLTISTTPSLPACGSAPPNALFAHSVSIYCCLLCARHRSY